MHSGKNVKWNNIGGKFSCQKSWQTMWMSRHFLYGWVKPFRQSLFWRKNWRTPYNTNWSSSIIDEHRIQFRCTTGRKPRLFLCYLKEQICSDIVKKGDKKSKAFPGAPRKVSVPLEVPTLKPAQSNKVMGSPVPSTCQLKMMMSINSCPRRQRG